MKQLCCLAFLFMLLTACAQEKNNYQVIASYHIASPGGWDYIKVNEGKIYVSHSTQVNILNEANGDSVGVITGTTGVHGIAFDNALHKGYTSNGRLNNVTVFDTRNHTVLTQVAAGEGPDAIMFEPFTNTIITCNGRSKDLSLIDATNDKLIATIAVGGKPEEAVSDEKGKLFVNLEDKNEIAVVDLKEKKTINHWPLQGEGPTGLAYDRTTQRLFAGCDNQLVVMDAQSGKVIDKLPIGAGCDGVVYNAKNHIIFASNGGSGTITAIKEVNANKFTVLGNYATKRSARTIALNEENGRLYLPAADFAAKQQANERPAMIAGSFQVLVVAVKK